jgi:hypothetical protein
MVAYDRQMTIRFPDELGDQSVSDRHATSRADTVAQALSRAVGAWPKATWSCWPTTVSHPGRTA